MTEALQATEHFNQELTRLTEAPIKHFPNLRQHLNLKPIWRTNHANEIGNLHHSTPTPLRNSQPRHGIGIG